MSFTNNRIWNHFFDNHLDDWRIKDALDSYIYIEKCVLQYVDAQNVKFYIKQSNKIINKLIFDMLHLFKEEILILEYLDFTENHIIKHVNKSFILENWDINNEQLQTFFINNFGYQSDYGFHLFDGNNIEFTYFYGEDINGYDINIEPNTFEYEFLDYHIFVVQKSSIFNNIIQKNKLVSLNFDKNLTFNFGTNLKELILRD